ncbi:hypothetical protein [Actinomadura atramentaria]|uniref:hypothetical protein n=1 Tax=Actinomadura atramentaria TaxID=1990 RepID=UPI00036B5DFB|nr:hypothetical protein [Actinomadura atramentaria]
MRDITEIMDAFVSSYGGPVEYHVSETRRTHGDFSNDDAYFYKVSATYVRTGARFTLHGGELLRVLKNAIPFASTDETLPGISSVAFEVSEPVPGRHELKVHATDRYVMSRETPTLPSQDDLPGPVKIGVAPGKFMISLDDAKNLTKALPKMTRGMLAGFYSTSVEVREEVREVTYIPVDPNHTGWVPASEEEVRHTDVKITAMSDGGQQNFTLRGLDMPALKFDKFFGREWAGEGNFASGTVDGIAFNPKYLALLAKVVPAGYKAGVLPSEFVFGTSNVKPVIAHVGTEFKALFMPIRVTDAAVERYREPVADENEPTTAQVQAVLERMENRQQSDHDLAA